MVVRPGRPGHVTLEPLAASGVVGGDANPVDEGRQVPITGSPMACRDDLTGIYSLADVAGVATRACE